MTSPRRPAGILPGRAKRSKRTPSRRQPPSLPASDPAEPFDKAALDRCDRQIEDLAQLVAASKWRSAAPTAAAVDESWRQIERSGEIVLALIEAFPDPCWDDASAKAFLTRGARLEKVVRPVFAFRRRRSHMARCAGHEITVATSRLRTSARGEDDAGTGVAAGGGS